MQPEQLTQEIDARRTELMGILCDLIRAKTVNPPGDEYLGAQVVGRYLKRWGLEYELFEKEPKRTNLVARLGTTGPAILVACHLDVVPAGEGWRTNPFNPVLNGNRVCGRGACDNKGPLAAMLLLASLLKQHESALKCQLILAAVADEERGSAYGMEYLLGEGILQADYAIIPDVGGSLRTIDVAEKGILFVRVISHGVQAHGSTPELGVNAVWNMVDLLNDLRDLDLTAEPHPLFTPTTINLGTIQGGSAPNMVPASCEVQFDVRYLPTQSQEEILAKIRDRVEARQSRDDKAKFDVETVTHLPPSAVNEDNPLVRTVRRCAQTVIGECPEPIGLSGATVTKQLLEKGIVAIGFAPGEADQPHVANESVDLVELLDFAKIVGTLCLEGLDARGEGEADTRELQR